jgi:hypothetical protein
MQPKRFRAETAQRIADRRQRENDAPRLHDVVPRLSALQIAFSDGEAGAIAGVAHLRRVVIERAPALFSQRCANPSCKGEHEITSELMAGLRRGEERIVGEDPCLAPVGSSSCHWVLSYVATANYAASPASDRDGHA